MSDSDDIRSILETLAERGLFVVTVKEKRVLEAAEKLPEATLAFWRATRHIKGFDPAREFIDAVVDWRGAEEEGR